jgi:ATP-dependent DNA helicase RecQ
MNIQEFHEYQRESRKTWGEVSTDSPIVYPTLGLVNEAGELVENFARQVAASLSLAYIPAVVKIRNTREQKDCTNWLQKVDNVKDAFEIRPSQAIAGRTLLLIDDIYDSGRILREIGRVLMQAGANAVYPFALVRTKHSDDQ